MDPTIPTSSALDEETARADKLERQLIDLPGDIA